MADEKLISKIEDWLRGDMPPGEAAAFKAQMDADASLAEEVALHRLTLRAMQQLSEQDLQGKVMNWLGDEPLAPPLGNEPTAPPRISPKWPWVSLALLMVLIAGALGIKAWGAFNDKERQKEIDALKEQLRSLQLKVNEQASLHESENSKLDSLLKEYAKLLEKATNLENQLNTYPQKEANKSRRIANLDGYYSLPTWTDDVRSETNTGNTMAVLTAAVVAFNDSNFQIAAEKAQQVIDAEPGNSAAIRLLAHALFNQKRYLEAIEAFNQLRTVTLYEDEADWNLMLCHWMLSKIDAGQRLDFERAVKQLAKSQNPRYAAKAKDLIQLEKVK